MEDKLKRNFVRNLFLTLLIVFSTQIFAQEIQFSAEDDFSKVTDGPYVFWKDNIAAVEYVMNGHKVYQEIRLKEPGSYPFNLEGFEEEFEITTFPPMPDPDTYEGVKKIFVVSDIHGQYDRFVQILQGNKVIDAENNWIWEEGHLVILGDVMDRGPKVTECLWLIHKLETQAALWSGKIHFLLGNHELMVMRGDTRYVPDKYQFVAEKLGRSFYKFYSPESEFGRWLRSKNTIIKINGMLFVHAGLHPKVISNNYSISEMNIAIRENIDSPDNSIKFSDFLSFLFKSDGPFWYRGYFGDTKSSLQIKQQELWDILSHYKASHIIVGHTTQDFINPFFNDKVIPVDSGIKYGDEGEGLLWKGGIFYRAKADGILERLTFK
jgi:Calcineurin-like phosphoesterase